LKRVAVESQSVQERGVFAKIFVSPAERRLRAGWRLLLQVLLQIFMTAAAGLVLYVAGNSLFMKLGGDGALAALAAGEVIETFAMLTSLLLVRRFLDHRPFESLGLRMYSRTALDLAAGIGITFVIMGLIFGAEWALGWLTVKGSALSTTPVFSVITNATLWLGVFVAVGWNEELMSRGYHMQTIASGMGWFWGLMISSAIFGLLHLGNPNATWLSAAGIFFAGVFLGYAYLRTGQLWLSIGLHIGWNFFEGVVFGFPVSGLDTYRIALATDRGPNLWTGGAFGPEAGLIILPALAIGLALIYLYTRRRTVNEQSH
jgi:membrane protease YdiL (CAAX protease family)